jgi:3-hydroxyisobutyrate dehydrogenase-like beta-hydroxyacid dehydrogenase
MTGQGALRIGFVGLGDQGGPMARAIAAAGWPLAVWARRAASLEAVAGLPHAACSSLAELAGRSDVVGLCLRGDSDVAAVLLDGGLLAALRPGGVVLNHGTGSPERSVTLHEQAKAAGVWFLDAPVSGGRAAAEAGTLTTMVGGGREAFDRCRPVLEAFSAAVVHLGPPGSGQLAKLVNNALFAANLRNAADMLALAAELGLDPRVLAGVVATSSGRSFALEAIDQHIRPALAAHYQQIIGKDLEALSVTARGRGVSRSPLEDRADSGTRDLAEAVLRYHGDG